ncbi:hypothetical protein J5N97_011377 [Dioscorea zingiberensis]|uniref:Uncharacterized protein n=1 Tax=Dioscorea zingiberensis TaxID=325984 RepID=A0A9D5D295_9LILI|nr:hypothetical protein J5N97_011377 [Dioscorea zingiberensis]
MPAQPFIFRNYQYPAGTPEIPSGMPESPAIGAIGSTTHSAQLGRRTASIGSCKHHIWQAIRASSAAPYYLDDFSDGIPFYSRLLSYYCSDLARKGGWRYLDTGQVLIESACSVDRVEEALDTLMPLLPEMHYFRFNPVDERCGMELDETDPAVWLKLEAATEEFIQKNSQSFKNLCELLVPRYQNEEKALDKSKSLNLSKKPSSADVDENSPSLGWRRMVLLVESLYSSDTGKVIHHARSLETFCTHNGIRLSLTSHSSGFSKPVTAFPTPFTSPLFTGSFPSSPLVYSPEFGPQRINRIDLVPPLSLDGHQFGKVSASPPSSPLASRQPSIPVLSLHEKLQNLPQVGIIHLALQNDSTGSVLSWQNDVFVVAEPGELADRFLQSVKISLSSMLRGHRRKGCLFLS